MLSELPQAAIIAHRGASAYAPENTLAAFELALRQRANAIELDAKLSADGQVVIIHDQTVDRTTNNLGAVNSYTLAELQRMDAGSHFDLKFRGEPIPSLDNVFESIGRHTYINVELTNYASITDDLPGKVADCVKHHNITKRVLFSSFNPIALLRIRRSLPDAPIGLLAFTGWKGALARSWLGRLLSYQSLHPELNDVTTPLLKNAHRRDHKVFVYTVNQEQDIRRMFALGVDGIFTDDPVLAHQILSETIPN
jgi:glycerophosphoryl diester phosphodiesterase